MKKSLRQEMLEKRKKLSEEEIITKSSEIKKKLYTLPEFEDANKACIYVSLKDEVHTHDIIKENLKGKCVVVPKVNGEELLVCELRDFDELKEGSFCVLEPGEERRVFPQDIDCVVVPGVVFDREGFRIGFGRGFYDRLLSEVSCPKIGLCFDFQLVDQLPFEEHDIPVDIIVTETKVIKMSRENS